MSEMNILEIEDLNAGYGKAGILQEINMVVEKGGLTVIIGPNGAGKTTLLRSIYGLCDVYGGQVRFKDTDLIRLTSSGMATRGINYVPQDNNIFSSLTVQENLLMGLVNVRKRKTIHERLTGVFNRFPRLEERRKQQAGTLSGGERQMLAISCALVTDPELILLDEPSGGLMPTLVKGLFEEIQQIHKAGHTVLLVEQNAKLALEIADYGYILEGGQIRLQGEPEELAKEERVAKAYLGV